MDVYGPHGNHESKVYKKIKRKEHNQNAKENQQIKRKEIKRRRKEHRRATKTTKETVNTMAISIVTINNYFKCNGLNVPIKRHRVAGWIKKQDLPICCLQETHFRSKDTQTES